MANIANCRVLEYNIVEFVKKKATAVVPSNWIEPEDEDALPAVKILNKRKVTDYQTARRMLRTSPVVSDIDDPSTDEATTKIRKRAPPARLICEDDSDEEPPLAKKSSHPKESCGSTSKSRSFLNVPASPMHHQLPKDLPASLPSSERTVDKTIISLLEKILQKQRDLQRQLDMHLAECRKQEPSTPQLPAGFEPPIQQLEEFESFDLTLADEDIKEGVVGYLALIGGETPKEVVRRALGRLMHVELTLQFTFQGTPKKKAFKSLLLYAVMKKVVHQNPHTKNATDKDIDFAIREFFRCATDRNGGRMRRGLDMRSSLP